MDPHFGISCVTYKKTILKMKRFLLLLPLVILCSICTGQECNIEFEDFENWDTDWIPYYPGAAEPMVWEGWDQTAFYLDIASPFFQRDDTVALEVIHVIEEDNPGLLEYSFQYYNECGWIALGFLSRYESETDVDTIKYLDLWWGGMVIDGDTIEYCQDRGNDFQEYKFQLDYQTQTFTVVCPSDPDYEFDFDIAADKFYGVAFGSNQCGFLSDICVNNTPLFLDNDNDSYFSNVDCDDNDPAVNPGAQEIPYNGKDDDCNPMTLEDDLDQDDFELDLDCDDNDPLVNPNAIEIPYNGKDDDCNELTLEDDLDEDGFAREEDCNDSDPSINPDATDIPNNGIDEDCDGSDFISSTLELGGKQIDVFPIPTDRYLYIQGVNDITVDVFSTSGSTFDVMYSDGVLDLEGLDSGHYVIKISSKADPSQFATTRIALFK